MAVIYLKPNAISAKEAFVTLRTLYETAQRLDEKDLTAGVEVTMGLIKDFYGKIKHLDEYRLNRAVVESSEILSVVFTKACSELEQQLQ